MLRQQNARGPRVRAAHSRPWVYRHVTECARTNNVALVREAAALQFAARALSATSLRAVFRALTCLLVAGLPMSHACAKSRNGATTNVASKVAQFKEDDDVVSLQFSPDNQQLAVATGSTVQVHLWVWQRRAHIEGTLMKPPGTADLLSSSEGLRYSPDGHYLAVTHAIASDDAGASVVDIFDPRTGAAVKKISELRLGGAHSRIEFSPDGAFLVRTFDSDSRSGTGQFMVHRTDTWEVVWSLDTLPLNVEALALSRDGRFAAVSGYTAGPGIANRAQILVVDLAQRKIIRTLDHIFPENVAVESLAWNPDRIRLAAGASGTGHGGDDFSEPVFPPEPVKIVDVSNGQTLNVEPMEPTTISGLRFTSDGKYLIESGYPTRPGAKSTAVRIRDGEHAHLLQEIPIRGSFALALSADNRYIAIGDQSTVSIWTLQ